MENIGILIQARSGSTRLPKKVFLKLGGKSILELVYGRCAPVAPTYFVIPEDDVEMSCMLDCFGFKYFAGSEKDVLSRYYEGAKFFGLDAAIRITSDCPFIDPAYISHTIMLYLNGTSDYVTNCAEGCIDGQEVELLSTRALEWVNECAYLQEDREHVTTMIKRAPEKFPYPIIKWKSPLLIDWIPKMSIDTISDYQRMKKWNI